MSIDVMDIYLFVFTQKFRMCKEFSQFHCLTLVPFTVFSLYGRNIPLFWDVSICCISLVCEVHSRTSFPSLFIPSWWLLILEWSFAHVLWSLSGFPTIEFWECNLQVVSFAILIGLLHFLKIVWLFKNYTFASSHIWKSSCIFLGSVENLGGCSLIAFRESKKAKSLKNNIYQFMASESEWPRWAQEYHWKKERQEYLNYWKLWKGRKINNRGASP